MKLLTCIYNALKSVCAFCQSGRQQTTWHTSKASNLLHAHRTLQRQPGPLVMAEHLIS